MKNLKLFLLFSTSFLMLFACNNGQKSKGSKDVKKDVERGIIVVVCNGGSYYSTSQPYYGGCGDKGIDYIIYNVRLKADGSSSEIDKGNRKLSVADIKRSNKKAREFYAKETITCDCGGGTVVVCGSDIGDCEGICDEAKKILEEIR